MMRYNAAPFVAQVIAAAIMGGDRELAELSYLVFKQYLSAIREDGVSHMMRSVTAMLQTTLFGHQSSCMIMSVCKQGELVGR